MLLIALGVGATLLVLGIGYAAAVLTRDSSPVAEAGNNSATPDNASAAESSAGMGGETEQSSQAPAAQDERTFRSLVQNGSFAEGPDDGVPEMRGRTEDPLRLRGRTLGEAFTEMDENRDGVLDPRELLRHQFAARVINEVDAHGNGELSLQELEQAMRSKDGSNGGPAKRKPRGPPNDRGPEGPRLPFGFGPEGPGGSSDELPPEERTDPRPRPPDRR